MVLSFIAERVLGQPNRDHDAARRSRTRPSSAGRSFAGSGLATWARRSPDQPPKGGDDTRGWPPFRGGVGAVFLSANRNKQSLALDLKTEGGRDAARRMVAQADVLIESYATGVAERLGIGSDDMRALNPRLIYCSISGFGRTGPLKDGLGYDVILRPSPASWR